MEAKADFITKYTNVVDGSKAIMLLYDYIGYDQTKNIGIKGSWFADEMYYHKAQGRTVTVYINSPGGQVFDTFNMIQAVLDCEAATHIVGMAASAAGILAQFGKYRTMNDFAVGMIHGASGKDDRLTKIIAEQLKDCLLKNSKLSEKEINKMMATTDPSWLDSSEMLEMGLVDEVIITGVESNEKIKFKKSNAKIFNLNESFKIYSDIVNSLQKTDNLNPNDMEEIKAVGAELGIENATKDSVINKVKELKTAAAEKPALDKKVLDAETAKTAAETAKNTAEEAFKNERKARATELVENAIAAGKIKEEAKQSYIDLAVTNYDLAKTTLTGLATAGVHNTVMNTIGTGKEQSAAAADAETYENLAKNDPKKLMEIAEKEPAKFEKLVAEHNKKQSTSK